MSKAIFYHAGTAISTGAKPALTDSANQEKYQTESNRLCAQVCC
ncbi:MAG: hypothetical protein ACXV7J_12420 [Methylomonas sp.]